MQTNYMDRVNPNLIFILHYVTKVAWMMLAAFFGVIGTYLYLIGIDEIGSGKISISKFSVSLDDAGPGLFVMIAALLTCLYGATKARVKLGPEIIELAAHSDPEKSTVKTFEGRAGDLLMISKEVALSLQSSDAAIIFDETGKVILATHSLDLFEEGCLDGVLSRAQNLSKEIAKLRESTFKTRGDTYRCTVRCSVIGNMSEKPMTRENDTGSNVLVKPYFLATFKFENEEAQRAYVRRETKYLFPVVGLLASERLKKNTHDKVT